MYIHSDTVAHHVTIARKEMQHYAMCITELHVTISNVKIQNIAQRCFMVNLCCQQQYNKFSSPGTVYLSLPTQAFSVTNRTICFYLLLDISAVNCSYVKGATNVNSRKACNTN
jgi:hypothetical protein